MSELFAKSGPEWTSLETHLRQVAIVSIKFADYLKMNDNIAYNGAILHDIGKAHPFFQDRLLGKTNKRKVFRHEITSLFFISAFPKDQWQDLIEMVAGHHKSVKFDIGEKGLLDLDQNSDSYIEFHLGDWELWSSRAIAILNKLEINTDYITKETALENLDYCIHYCENITKVRGYSKWRGLLIGADYFASSLKEKTETEIKRIFKKPMLNFYNRKHPLYPLSHIDANSNYKHSIVVASTGAGKTDFLFRRCKGRVFYILPFQASINAMYKRVGNDLEHENPDLDIRVLHSSSSIVKRKENEEIALQNLIGSAVKILTPHQLASIAFGMQGFEALILDLKGCDVVLDEVHTYSGISQALVLKLIGILKFLDCRIHIGTATMPSILYDKIKEVLVDDIMEIKLDEEQLDKFDRHIVHKIDSFESTTEIIIQALEKHQKILIVLNKVGNAQKVFNNIKEKYPEIPNLLLHSRFKRGDRNKKEKDLIGLADDATSLGIFNTSSTACIVVSTQIVEVSLDINFDVLITETAPLDALIQRFGRINRKRTKENIGKYKDVYVIAPGINIKDSRPYDLEVLHKSYAALDDSTLLKEISLQGKIDKVFTSLNFSNIEEHSVFKSDGNITIDKLTHHGKSILFDLLDIDSVACILESDIEQYDEADFEGRILLEIPTYFYAVSKMSQSVKGNKPFIIPDRAYDYELGLDVSKIKEENFNVLNRFL